MKAFPQQFGITTLFTICGSHYEPQNMQTKLAVCQ